MTHAIYSPERAQQLRYLLWTALVLGVVSLALAAVVLLAGDATRFAVFIGVPALLLLPASVLTLRAMDERGAPARTGSIVTGLLLIVVGLFLTSLVVGLLPSIIGVLVLLLALLPESGDR